MYFFFFFLYFSKTELQNVSLKYQICQNILFGGLIEMGSEMKLTTMIMTQPCQQGSYVCSFSGMLHGSVETHSLLFKRSPSKDVLCNHL